MRNTILVHGARENNLKNVDVEIPRDALCVFTGLSGSGKSSLAFDTIYAEGRRRYVESLSAYVRQFLGQMDKPDVDVIEGLSPAISIDQKTTSKNPRSTVGTVTEIYDYLRLLWARVGTPHCPRCGREIKRQSVDQILDRVLELPEGTRFAVLAPVIRGKKGEHSKVLESARRGGFARVRVDGNLYDLSEEISLEKNKKHFIELVVDRLITRGDITRRLTDSVETALSHGDGVVIIHEVDNDRETLYSRNYACDECGISIPELSPRLFSFNNPMGACPECSGLGYRLKADPELVIPDPKKSIYDGGIEASGWGNIRNDSIARMYSEALAQKYRFDLHAPIESLPDEAMKVFSSARAGKSCSFAMSAATAAARSSRPSRASCPTLSAASARHSPTRCARSWRNICRPRPARTAAASGSRILRGRSRSAACPSRSSAASPSAGSWTFWTASGSRARRP